METLIAVIAFAILIAISKWIQDTLLFRSFTAGWITPFDSIKNRKLYKWFNPKISWKNKHEWFKGNKALTWLISNPLVALTDAWHTLELIRNSLPYIIIAFISDCYWVLAIYLIQISIFHVLFTYTNKRNKN